MATSRLAGWLQLPSGCVEPCKPDIPGTNEKWTISIQKFSMYIHTSMVRVQRVDEPSDKFFGGSLQGLR